MLKVYCEGKKVPAEREVGMRLKENTVAVVYMDNGEKVPCGNLISIEPGPRVVRHMGVHEFARKSVGYEHFEEDQLTKDGALLVLATMLTGCKKED